MTNVDESSFIISGNGDVIEMLINVPTGTFPHILCEISSATEGYFEVYEGTTTSADGTSLTRLNRSRDSTNTANMTMFHTPTITTDGTKIWDGFFGSAGTSETGGISRSNNEFILKQNTKYLIRYTSESNNNRFKGMVDWYE